MWSPAREVTSKRDPHRLRRTTGLDVSEEAARRGRIDLSVQVETASDCGIDQAARHKKVRFWFRAAAGCEDFVMMASIAEDVRENATQVMVPPVGHGDGVARWTQCAPWSKERASPQLFS